ncbi:hypothetical protein BH24BAC1_BH24BAC1_40230 [soil metagenome]
MGKGSPRKGQLDQLPFFYSLLTAFWQACLLRREKACSFRITSFTGLILSFFCLNKSLLPVHP